MTVPDAGFSLSYGPLEAAIAVLCDAPVKAVRMRFRKFRLRDFPDHIQIGSGSRVSYDLPRALAMCAAFSISNGVVSLTAAEDLVAETWPEWCRALLAAAVEGGLLSRPEFMPREAGPIVTLIPAGFGVGEDTSAMATSSVVETPALPPVLCLLSIDVRAILDTILSAPATGEIGDALRHLEQTFGWSRPLVPMRGKIEDMPSHRGFLDDGPYFSRASALLDLSEGPPAKEGTVRLWRLKLLIDYLQRPAPVDGWKACIGDEDNLQRLGHLLAVSAREAGAKLLDEYPQHIDKLVGTGARVAARGHDRAWPEQEGQAYVSGNVVPRHPRTPSPLASLYHCLDAS